MFEGLINFFYITLYQPLFNFLIFLYNNVPGHDFGIAIIILTLVIRFILYPLSVKAASSQKNLQKLQPRIKEIQKEYKDNKEQQAKQIMNLYKTEKINPFSGLLLAFIQLPILIALYKVFWSGLNPEELSNLYSFVSNPGQINTMFLSVIDLSKPNIPFALLAGVTQFFQTKMLLPEKKKEKDEKNSGPDFSQMIQKQMTYFFPFFTIIILFGLPSALGLYWIISGLFSIIQQHFVFKKNKKKEIEN